MTNELENKINDIITILNLSVLDHEQTPQGITTIKVNDYQSLSIRLSDWKGKGSARLFPPYFFRDIYFDNDKSTLGIGFSPDKSAKDIARDIARRILSSPLATEQKEYIEATVKGHNEDLDNQKKLQEDLTAIGFEILDSGKAYYNHEGNYFIIRTEYGRPYFESFSPDSDQTLDIITAIMKTIKGK